jgi:hypothetical protein
MQALHARQQDVLLVWCAAVAANLGDIESALG